MMSHPAGDEGATSTKIFISPSAPSTQAGSLMMSGARHARRNHRYTGRVRDGGGSTAGGRCKCARRSWRFDGLFTLGGLFPADSAIVVLGCCGRVDPVVLPTVYPLCGTVTTTIPEGQPLADLTHLPRSQISFPSPPFRIRGAQCRARIEPSHRRSVAFQPEPSNGPRNRGAAARIEPG